ncbi:hypothetical protein B0H14DRAFT_3863678 [Mycena olivaceomarginata]|nr:hypothetical protein B0H14DRAFT_3863678 [Mycena olivaceomarginata]
MATTGEYHPIQSSVMPALRPLYRTEEPQQGAPFVWDVETDESVYAMCYLGLLDAVIDYPAFYNLTLSSQAPRATSLSSPLSLRCRASPRPPLCPFHPHLHHLVLSKSASVPALPGLASSSYVTAFLENHASTTLFLASPAPLLLSTAFFENHDKPCFPSLTVDGALRKNATVELFVGDGILT